MPSVKNDQAELRKGDRCLPESQVQRERQRRSKEIISHRDGNLWKFGREEIDKWVRAGKAAGLIRVTQSAIINRPSERF